MEQVKSYKNVELVKETFGTAKIPEIRNDFIAKLENALMFLSYNDLNMWHCEGKNKVHLKQFDGAWLIDVSLRQSENEAFTFTPFGDFQVTPNMFPDLNIKLMNLSSEIAYLSKYKFLNLKEKQKLENFKYIFSEKIAFLDYGKCRWWTDENGYGFNSMLNNKNYNYVLPIPISLTPGYIIKREDALAKIKTEINEKDSPYMITLRNFHMSLQLSLSYYYEWSCYIKEKPDSIGVKIPIHPSSSKDVFILRNIPEGESRKKAIVNFVKDHYRTITDYKGDERDVLIKKHLRGELKFNWRGLEVHIIPSIYDLNRVKTTKKFIKI